MKPTDLLLCSVLLLTGAASAFGQAPLAPQNLGQAYEMAADSPYYEFGSELTVVNDSHYDFMDIAIARLGDPIWSENLLGGDPLFPGEALTIANLACDTYDLMIVDHTDTTCVLEGFPLCNGDLVTTWITDYDLSGANCE